MLPVKDVLMFVRVPDAMKVQPIVKKGFAFGADIVTY